MNRQYHKSNMASSEYMHNTIDAVIEEIGNLMQCCYGPYGSHVLIATPIGLEAVKDGQRILTSYVADAGIAKSVREALISVSNKQAEEIGDGTTTTILLLRELYKFFRKTIEEESISPSILNKNIGNAVKNIIDWIPEYTTKIKTNSSIDWDTLYNAIYTSVDGNTELADIILKMYKELGVDDPLILIDTNTTDSHRYELVKGVELDGAPISSDIFFNGYSRKDCTNPNIIVINGRMDMSTEYILNLDRHAMQSEQDFIFLCTGINDDTLSALTSIKKTNSALLNRITFFQIDLIASNPKFMDMCASIGATPIDSETLTKISSESGLLKMMDVNAGHCEKAAITEFCIRFNNPKTDSDMVDQRLEDINNMMEDLKADPTSHNEVMKNLESRKAFLSRHYAKLYVGGSSPQRRSINYELAKDGVLQAESCLKHGVVYGCNILIPNIIRDKVQTVESISDIEKIIYENIHDSYIKVMEYLIMNKTSSKEDIDKLIRYNKTQNLEAFNLRDETPVLNSAATDVTILKNATDMASLLATSSAYLSKNPEFDALMNLKNKDE